MSFCSLVQIDSKVLAVWLHLLLSNYLKTLTVVSQSKITIV